MYKLTFVFHLLCLRFVNSIRSASQGISRVIGWSKHIYKGVIWTWTPQWVHRISKLSLVNPMFDQSHLHMTSCVLEGKIKQWLSNQDLNAFHYGLCSSYLKSSSTQRQAVARNIFFAVFILYTQSARIFHQKGTHDPVGKDSSFENTDLRKWLGDEEQRQVARLSSWQCRLLRVYWLSGAQGWHAPSASQDWCSTVLPFVVWSIHDSASPYQPQLLRSLTGRAPFQFVSVWSCFCQPTAHTLLSLLRQAG